MRYAYIVARLHSWVPLSGGRDQATRGEVVRVTMSHASAKAYVAHCHADNTVDKVRVTDDEATLIGMPQDAADIAAVRAAVPRLFEERRYELPRARKGW